MSADVSEAVERLKVMTLSRSHYHDDSVVMVSLGDLRKALAALQEGSGALPASPSGGQWRTDFENLPKSGRALFYRPLAEATNDEVVAVKTIVNGSRDVCWDKTIPEGQTAFNPTDGMCHVTHWMPLPDAPSMGMSEANAPQPSPEPRDREEG